MILKIILVLAFICIAQGDEGSEDFGKLITLSESGFQNALKSRNIHGCIKNIKSDYEKAVQNFIGEMVGFSCETAENFKEFPETNKLILMDKINPVVCSVKLYPLMSQELNKVVSAMKGTIAAINDYDKKLRTFLQEFKDKTELNHEKLEEAEKATQKYSEIREKTIKEFKQVNQKYLVCFYMGSNRN